ncbi:hypothetical protein [Pigmentiphaga soli]
MQLDLFWLILALVLAGGIGFIAGWVAACEAYEVPPRDQQSNAGREG